jgi:hypothetical protein
VEPEKTFQGDFFFMETDKFIYYPGEMMEVSVHIRLTETLYRAESLVL